MQRLSLIVLILALASAQVFVLGRATEEKNLLPLYQGDDAVMPSPVLKVAVFEFDGLASDFMFLKALVFMGSTLERADLPTLVRTPFKREKKSISIIEEWEWKWLYGILDASTGLDPYFLDPYYVANANLTWGGGLIRETNLLLEKGSRYRNWDWQLPFYVGFNNFFFLHDNIKASEYLMEASRRPGGNPGFASLASKLAYEEHKTEISILLLEEITKTTDDEALKKMYLIRLGALKSILTVEKSVAAYKKRFGKTPRTVEELLQRHVLKELPIDPYGGKYYIDPQGTVRTTSEARLMPGTH
jgi:hypothetical protein